MRIKGLACLGILAGDNAAAGRFLGETLGLEVAFDEGPPWNWLQGTVTGSSCAAPATATSSPAAATTPASSHCSRWTTWIGRAPNWPAAAVSYSASRRQTAPGPDSPSGRPTEHPPIRLRSNVRGIGMSVRCADDQGVHAPISSWRWCGSRLIDRGIVQKAIMSSVNVELAGCLFCHPLINPVQNRVQLVK